MYNKVGIPSDGGSEVSIIRKAKSVVAYIIRCINCFSHRTNQKAVDYIFFGFAFDCACQFSDFIFIHQVNIISELLYKYGKFFQLIFIRQVMNPVNKWVSGLMSVPEIMHIFCNRTICNEHKFFNQSH